MDIRVLDDLTLSGSLVLAGNNASFPSNPAIGTFLIKDQNLYGYVTIGDLTTWYPFGSRTRSYVQTQGVAATTWTVNHNLGTNYVWFQVQDTTGNVVEVGKTNVDDNTFTLNFTAPQLGTVVVVAPDSIDVPEVSATVINVGPNVQLNTSGLYINGSAALTSANIQSQIDSAVAAVVSSAPDALNTLAKIDAQLASDESAAAALTTTVAGKADKATTLSGYGITDAYTKSQVDTALGLKANSSSLATVATSGSYADLTNKPTIPTVPTAVSAFTNDSGYQTAANVSSSISTAIAGKADTSSLATVATTGKYSDLTGTPTLATVATTGSYSDLTGAPSLGGSTSANFSAQNLTISGNIMPTVTGMSNIGSASDKFGSIYAKELYLDSNTLYVNGVAVLSSSASTLNFTSDTNQGISITTTGTGQTVLNSQAETIIQTNGQNADVLIQSGGQGSLTRVTSATQITLTAPTVATVGDATISGGLTVSGNLDVKGTVTTIESTNTTIKDNILTLNKGEGGSGVTLGVSGIEIDRGNLTYQRLLWKESTGKWVAGEVNAEVPLATESYVTTAISGKANTSSLATVATSGSYNDLTNKPTLFSGSYTDLTNKPTLFSGAYADLTGKPTLATVATSGSYADLTNKPTLFSGAYADLTGKPSLATVATTGAYSDLTGTPSLATVATSGSYTDLINKPTIPVVPTAISAFSNDVGYLTSATAAGTYAAKATTLAGYGITDAITAATAASTYAAKATTLAGYGITDAITAATAASTYAAKATTLSGYGITDAINTSAKGAANGVATLDSTGKLPASQLTASVVGAVVYQGVWNASTNTPTLTSGTGTKGNYYKVSTAGTTTVDGISQWNAGDVIIFDGTTWDKIDGLSSEVISVAGRVGAVTLSSSDISGLAASATTDTTNASNITSGTLASARLPAFTSSQITTALGFTPYNATNPSGYLSSISSAQVVAALGFTPYNSTNPSGYLSAVQGGSF